LFVGLFVLNILIGFRAARGFPAVDDGSDGRVPG